MYQKRSAAQNIKHINNPVPESVRLHKLIWLLLLLTMNNRGFFILEHKRILDLITTDFDYSLSFMFFFFSYQAHQDFLSKIH
jgi:hypothetical protein